MSWLEIWAMLQVLGITFSVILIIIYLILLFKGYRR